MRVLIIDIEVMGLDFALRCAAAGHAVRWYRHMPKHQDRAGEGFKQIKLVDDWRPSMECAKDGLNVLTGNFTLTHELNRYREFGYRIFAPTPASAKLEIDRTTVWKWRTNPSRLDPGKMEALAQALDIEPAELYRPPQKLSLDAIVRDYPDDLLQKAAEIVRLLGKTG